MTKHQWQNVTDKTSLTKNHWQNIISTYQHCNLVSGSWILGEFMICSREYSSWNWEYLLENDNIINQMHLLNSIYIWFILIWKTWPFIHWFVKIGFSLSIPSESLEVFNTKFDGLINRRTGCWWNVCGSSRQSLQSVLVWFLSHENFSH